MERPDAMQNTELDEDEALRLLIEKMGMRPCKAHLTKLAEMLSRIARKPKGRYWGYKYLHSVLRGHYKASPALRAAILRALFMDNPLQRSGAVLAEVWITPGAPQRAYVMGIPRICAREDCSVLFIPNHPSRKYCPFCSPPKGGLPPAQDLTNMG